MKKLKSLILFPMLFVVCTRAAAGSNTHNTDYKGNVISRSALLKNQFEIVKYLVDKGADGVRNNAALSGNLDMPRFLVDRGDVHIIHLDGIMQIWAGKYI